MPRKILSITVACIIGWIFTYVATNVYRHYAFGLFIWLPFAMGLISTLIYAYKNPVDKKQLRNNTFLTLAVFFAGLLLFAWEGIICMLMAAPLGILFIYLGHLAGYALLKGALKNGTTTVIIFFILSIPTLMAFEDRMPSSDEVRLVSTSIEINASPEKVWTNVVTFPPLKDPTEFIFKTGIAYPINATITGRGVGAVRHCNFSTGSFVEPITNWEEPTLLRFSVDEQPEPMKEISFYDIHPTHLHGYWVSQQGQFRLIKLANGQTLLEGTTWYVNKIKPGLYWTI
ncbi:MAG: hypothetical protein ABUL46_05870, partial [Chitinophaga rupis]